MVSTIEDIRNTDEGIMSVPGGDDIVVTREHFTSDRAWERLFLGLPLDPEDFADLDMAKRYWYLSHKLTEGLVVVGGNEGGGKSLWLYYTAWHMRKLFGKTCTFDVPPKKTFGQPFYNIDSEMFCEELDKFKELAIMEQAKEEGEVTEEEFEAELNKVKLFNAVVSLDEAYDKLEKARRTNFAINFGRFAKKYRHFHSLIILVSPDMEDIDKRMAFNRRKHEVHCSYNEYTGKCRYRIWKRQGNIWTGQELTPSNWSFLWETHNIIGSTVLPLRRK